MICNFIINALKGGLSKMPKKWEKLFVPFLVDVLTDKPVSCRNAFSTDMNVLTDKCGLLKFPVRGKMSIERLRWMNLIVHRTYTTKPECNFPDSDPKFFTPHLKGRHLELWLKFACIPVSSGNARCYCYKAFSLNYLFYIFYFSSLSRNQEMRNIVCSKKMTE